MFFISFHSLSPFFFLSSFERSSSKKDIAVESVRNVSLHAIPPARRYVVPSLSGRPADSRRQGSREGGRTRRSQRAPLLLLGPSFVAGLFSVL